MTTSSARPPAGSENSDGPAIGRDYLVRSEEQLRVRTDRVPAGYARLEKFTVTETKTITVEVTHEEVRLVRSAVGDRLGAPAPTSAAAADSDRWMVLSREEVVVTKQVVPVERVRLEVYPVTEQREFVGEVRKEHFDSNLDTGQHTGWRAGSGSGTAI